MEKKKEERTKEGERKDEKTRLKKILEFTPGIFFVILAVLAVAFVVFQEIVGDIFDKLYLQVYILAAVLTVVCLVVVWRAANIIVEEERKQAAERIYESNKAVIAKVDRFSENCMKGLLMNQKRLFGTYLDDLNQIREEDIIKVLDFLDAIKRYDPQGILTIEETKKVQEFLRSLLGLGEKHALCAYADMKDLKWLEQTVEENGTIDVISQNVTDNKELKEIIIENLKKGIHYNYYLYREAGIDELKQQFSENVEAWKREVGEDVLKKQVKCWTVPPECVQMVIIIYNAHNLERDSEYKTGVVVKLPKVTENVKRDFPLFFYITDHRDLLVHFKKSLDYLKRNSTEYNYL